MIHYTQCPSCGSKAIAVKSLVKDFSVSGESFSLMTCENCKLTFTQDVPDESEIGLYYKTEQYISHSDTNRGIINKLYHIIRWKTTRSKRNLVKKETGMEHGKLLDIGGGTGSFMRVMEDAGWNVVGIEPDESARKNALRINNIQLYAPDKMGNLEDSSFDAITMWHVLEHVHGIKNQIRQIGRLLKKEGVLFIAVPNHNSWDARYYGVYWAAWDVPRHLYHFTPESMCYLWKENGFEVVGIKPMWYDSFYVSMLSEKHKRRRTQIFRPFCVGAWSNIKSLVNNEVCSSLIYIIRKV